MLGLNQATAKCIFAKIFCFADAHTTTGQCLLVMDFKSFGRHGGWFLSGLGGQRRYQEHPHSRLHLRACQHRSGIPI